MLIQIRGYSNFSTSVINSPLQISTSITQKLMLIQNIHFWWN